MRYSIGISNTFLSTQNSKRPNGVNVNRYSDEVQDPDHFLIGDLINTASKHSD